MNETVTSPDGVFWQTLTISQQRGFLNLIKLLGSNHLAVCESLNYPFTAYNNIIHISGNGQEIFLEFLITALNNGKIDQLETDSALKVLHNQAIICEPINLALPIKLNWYSAILARISAELENRWCQSPQKSCLDNYDDNPVSTALAGFYQTRLLVAKCLDGNLNERKSVLDRDAYASEVVEHSQECIAIPHSLDESLSNISKALDPKRQGHFFIIPITNTEYNREWIELLQLSRTLRTPRILLLLVGETNENILNIRRLVPPHQQIILDTKGL